MTKVTNVRAAADNSTSNSGSKPANIHWINLYRKGHRDPVNSIGGIPIDHMPDWVAACEANPNFAQNVFGSELVDAYYNVAGKSAKTAVVQDLSAFMK